MKKRVTITSANGVLIQNYPLFSGTKTIEIDAECIRNIILQNTIVMEHVGDQLIPLTLDNYNKDNSVKKVETVVKPEIKQEQVVVKEEPVKEEEIKIEQPQEQKAQRQEDVKKINDKK